jgi:TatD DNase family protein
MRHMTLWIDTHCHLDAAEFDADRDAVRDEARRAGVDLCVIPSVRVEAFDAVRRLAHRFGDGYALGIHPMCVAQASGRALDVLETALKARVDDPNLVAVGEIGLDYFVPELRAGASRARQELFFRAQLELAARHRLPVLLHVRRSVEQVLKCVADCGAVAGIAHAFNGSREQAERFLRMGFKLGFGGAVTYERATRLRQLAAELPAAAIVMETDAPDIPPQWLYKTATERACGAAQGRNRPAEVARIGAHVAALRGATAADWSRQTRTNALVALPRLAGLLR